MNSMRMLIAVAILLAIGVGSARAQVGTITLSSAGPGSNAGYINIQGNNANGTGKWNQSQSIIWITGGTGKQMTFGGDIKANGNFNVDVGQGTLTSGQSYWVVVRSTYIVSGMPKNVYSNALQATAK